MGWVPDWYITLKAAKYLGVPPWDLIGKSVVWIDWAIKALAAESHARKVQDERAARKMKNKRN